jgi:hypothetical protein
MVETRPATQVPVETPKPTAPVEPVVTADPGVHLKPVMAPLAETALAEPEEQEPELPAAQVDQEPAVLAVLAAPAVLAELAVLAVLAELARAPLLAGLAGPPVMAVPGDSAVASLSAMPVP